MSATTKLKQLETDCQSLEKLAVAFSGGLDSRFLCYTAKRIGLPVRALHISGPHIPQQETEEARAWAAENKIPFVLLSVDPLQNSDVCANSPDRCYYCKRAVFTKLLTVIQEEEHLCDGTNRSDLGGYRPGLRALVELGIRSPLARADICKGDIRELARRTGMDRPEQKARPCLFTRFEYGIMPTYSSISAVQEAERQVEEILSASSSKIGAQVPPFRLRITLEGPILHIQHSKLTAETNKALQATLRASGFSGVRVELVDTISGYFDRKRNLGGYCFFENTFG